MNVLNFNNFKFKRHFIHALAILQVLKGGEKYKFEHPNPFITEEEEGEVASVAYRYRKWDLGNDIVCFNFLFKIIVFIFFFQNLLLIQFLTFIGFSCPL